MYQFSHLSSGDIIVPSVEVYSGNLLCVHLCAQCFLGIIQGISTALLVCMLGPLQIRKREFAEIFFKGLKLSPHIKFLKHIQSLVVKITKTICGLGMGIG